MEHQGTHAPATAQNTTPLSHIRNVAIIAHVNHGKTTLVDGFLRQTGVFRSNEQVATCVMDSNDLERERGITILAKNTAVEYNGFHINIVDTPGHADFGGEVERILGMVDCAVLVVAAADGPMPQTRFVLRKALERGLRPMVVINKIDVPNIDANVALNKVFDLFVELGASEEQLDFPYVFASGAQGFAKVRLEDESNDLRPLLDLIVQQCPSPSGDPEASLQMQVSILDYSDFLGRIAIGRVFNGRIANGQQVVLVKENDCIVRGKITKLLKFQGLKRIEATEASAGELVAIAGFDNFNVSDTIASVEKPTALARIHVDEPTLKMSFLVNDSPLAGREGKFVTSRHLRDRLFRELETNVSLRVEETGNTSVFMVSGRGELHLGILIETMRREGYEFAVSRPEVIVKTIDGQDNEPFEKVLVDVREEYVGAIIQELGTRRGELLDMRVEGSQGLLEFCVPTRGLIGFHGRFVKLTKGTGVANQAFLEFRPWCGEIATQRSGVLVACEAGTTTAYALEHCEDRGAFFIKPGTEVYTGMVIGECNRPQDLGLNVCKAKKLTNIRTTSSEGILNLQPPIDMTLEKCLGYIGEDELIEVTPRSIRMRKRVLTKY